MVKNILTKAGFVEDETFKETRFVKPPKVTHCVFFDSFRSRGADGLNLIKEHTCIIELYSFVKDPEAERRLEESLDAYGLEYEKGDRTWIGSESLYLIPYYFDYIEK